MKRCSAQKTRREIERGRARDVLRKEKGILGEKKGALESECVKYLGTKFESYKLKYFGTEGVLLYATVCSREGPGGGFPLNIHLF